MKKIHTHTHTSDGLSLRQKGLYLMEVSKGYRPNPDDEQDNDDTGTSLPKFSGTPSQLCGAHASLCRPLHKKLRQNLEDGLRKHMSRAAGKRAIIHFMEAKGKMHLSWLTTQGISSDNRMPPDLYREVIGRIVGSHDANNSETGKLCGAGTHPPCQELLFRTHSIACTKTGAATFLHNRVVRVVSKTLRECSMHVANEDSTPFTEALGTEKVCSRWTWS